MSHKHTICAFFLLPLFVVAGVSQEKKPRAEMQIREDIEKAKQRVAELEKELAEVVPRGPRTSMRAKIYVAGPYSKGDVAVNVRNAFEAANQLADLGFAPFVPHSTHFWHMLFPRPYEFWLTLDNQFLPYCDA